MDPFTQRMLERAKSRREKLDSQKMVLEQRSPLQDKLNENVQDKASDSIRVSSTGKDPDNTKGAQFITSQRKSKLQKLARLYAGNDENVFLSNDEDCDETVHNTPENHERKRQCKLARLDELATKIKEWEDDVNCTKHSSSSHHSNLLDKTEEETSKSIHKEKQKFWDSEMIQKLCSVGFSASESQAKLMYDFGNKTGVQKDEKLVKSAECQLAGGFRGVGFSAKCENKIPVRNNNEILKKAAFFEFAKQEDESKTARDPAELPLAERKALFERNQGVNKTSVKNRSITTEPNSVVCRSEEKSANNKNLVLSKLVPSEKKENKSNENLERNTFSIDYKTKDTFKIQKPKNHVQSEGISTNQPYSEKLLEIIPQAPPLPSYQQNPLNESDDVKKGQDNDLCSSKGGKLYPSLSNLDLTDETEPPLSEIGSNDSKNSNFCLDMSLTDLLEMSKNNPNTPPSEQSFSKTKESQVLSKMDKLLEDALGDLSSSGDEDCEDFIPSKMKKSSSFEYKSGQDNDNFLLHSVSFYRKQQQKQQHITCMQSENMTDKESPSPRKDEDESIFVKNKIESLIAEVNRQQIIISQASQALNLCVSTVEFSGSGEQVEGERLLLLATHKRQACLNEIQRLKIENSLRPQGENNFLTDKGDVHLSNIAVKLKREALRAMAAAENLQYFVCLIKSDEQVLATPAVSAVRENLNDMVLQFPGQVKLEGLLGNFKISVEVYNLELGKELLPHDVKYHIITKKEKKLLTPIKSKKSESKLIKPHVQSPAGPNAVRSSNFQLCGYIVFSLREITRTQWILNKVPYVSLLEGTLSMTIHSQLCLNEEFKGFLTMFDDISGFGAWHRRWCILSSHFISYWKYPDDESKKVPIGTIDLRSVITENVGLVSRDICARLNTFLLETTRPRLNGDKDSLVVNVTGDQTTIRHLLSADSKQEMATWCKKLNKTLALLRSWKCNFNE